MSDDGDSESDRRQSMRYLACFPAHIQRLEDDGGGKPRTAMIKDLSVNGAFLLTRGNFTVGSPITLALYLRTDITVPRQVEGKVVRVTPRPIDRADFWHFDVGVQFDQAQTDVEGEIADLAQRQAALGIYRKP
jgi:Tfp pilus assembly protein PilZ